MILTRTCDLCGWNNDNNDGSCRHCGGETEERLIRGKWWTFMTKEPSIPLKGTYNPKVRRAIGLRSLNRGGGVADNLVSGNLQELRKPQG
jgi:hypothetical protein